jgi:hypothetical protein
MFKRSRMGKHRRPEEPQIAPTQPDILSNGKYHLYTTDRNNPYYMTDDLGDAISMYVWLINDGEPRVILDFMNLHKFPSHIQRKLRMHMFEAV